MTALPEAARLDETQVRELEKLGYRLARFRRAARELHRRGVAGKQPGWVVPWLERWAAEPAGEGEIRAEFTLFEGRFGLLDTDAVPEAALAFLRLRPLRDYWRRELSARQFAALLKVAPWTWALDSTPLPPHAVIPGLELHAWRDLPPEERERLILHVGGSVAHRGSTLSAEEWQDHLQEALRPAAAHSSFVQRPFREPELPVEGEPGHRALRVHYRALYATSMRRAELEQLAAVLEATRFGAPEILVPLPL